MTTTASVGPPWGQRQTSGPALLVTLGAVVALMTLPLGILCLVYSVGLVLTDPSYVSRPDEYGRYVDITPFLLAVGLGGPLGGLWRAIIWGSHLIYHRACTQVATIVTASVGVTISGSVIGAGLWLGFHGPAASVVILVLVFAGCAGRLALMARARTASSSPPHETGTEAAP